MSRQIDIRWMWIRDLVKMEILNFIFTRSKKNTSGSMTKVQGKPDFVRCRDELYGQMFGSHEKVIMSMQEIKGDWQVRTLDQILNLEEEDTHRWYQKWVHYSKSHRPVINNALFHY